MWTDSPLGRVVQALRRRLVALDLDYRSVAVVILLLGYIFRLRGQRGRQLEFVPRQGRSSNRQQGGSNWQQGSKWSSRESDGQKGYGQNRPVEERPGQCHVCGKHFLADRRGRIWPIVRAVFVGESSPRDTHLHCAAEMIKDRQDGGVALEPTFAAELREALETSPDLLKGNACLRLCHEEWHLGRAAKLAAEKGALTWPIEPPTVPPSRAIFSIENVPEMRISSCPLFKELPVGVASVRGLRTLVFISTGISSLPPEMGALRDLQILYLNGNSIREFPKPIAELPELQEICLDANQLKELPPITSLKLTLLTVPANKLTAAPIVAGALERLELHGNCLTAFELFPPPAMQWGAFDKLSRLKIMGNQITTLPEEIGLCRQLQSLAAADNCLKALPDAILKCRKLQWVILYNNALQDLPEGLLLCSQTLEIIMLEDNPLSAISIASMLEDLPRAKNVKLLGLDADQVRNCVSVFQQWRSLPWNVSVGSQLHTNSLSQYYMKLIRASHIKREKGVAAEGEPRSSPGPAQAPADLLVVAFSASQGEPEWMGLLGRLAVAGTVGQHAPLDGPLSEVLDGKTARGNASWSMEEWLVDNAKLATPLLWSGCRSDVEPEDMVSAKPVTEPVALGDFDALSLVDHGMHWYAADEEALSQTLASVCARYKHKIFIGASMGGFGALLHAGRLAREGLFGPGDAVVAFGPQSVLETATLRPPGDTLEGYTSIEGLTELRRRMTEAARTAGERGVTVEIHCAADEHLGHALAVPLRDLALHVHPIVPRKPFAKLLDKAGLLMPIVSDIFSRVLTPGYREEELPPMPSRTDIHAARAVVARWVCPEGRLGTDARLVRNWVSRYDLMQLLFGPTSSPMPRPGDWFCQKCHVRNMVSNFFCFKCTVTGGSTIVDVGNVRIPNGQTYPRSGDWGCGKCGLALYKYNYACTRCGSNKDDHAATHIAS